MRRVTPFVIAVALISLMASHGDTSASESLAIRTWYDLHAIRNRLSGHYVLMNDLDATTPGYRELASTTANHGRGWEPIGTFTNPFTGSFDGRGYKIKDLFADRRDEDGVGLFGHVAGPGVIGNVGVVNANMTGRWYVGGLVGRSEGTVTNCYSSGVVIGERGVGGLVGLQDHGNLANSYSTANVSGNSSVGGLVGWNDGAVNNCYATGSVTGEYGIGGLVGHNVGGPQRGTISNSYSCGKVSGSSHVGGLVGWNDGTVNNSFWDIQTSGQPISAGGRGKTTTEMNDIRTFSEATWDIASVAVNQTNRAYTWNIIDGKSYPFLSGKHPARAGSLVMGLIIVAVLIGGLVVIFMSRRRLIDDKRR